MTLREKRLAMLLAMVALLAAVDYVVEYVILKPDTGPVPQKLETARSASSQTMAAVAGLTFDAEKRRALIATETPLVKDPLVMPEETQMSLRQTARRELLASGYMLLGKKAYAIIGGQEYTVGENLTDTGDLVVDIREDGVLLRDPDTKAERLIPYAKTPDPTDLLMGGRQ